MKNLDRYKFVFLCGLHRSGTSPLFRILRDHPDVSGFKDTGVPEDEGQHLQTVVPAAKVYGGPGRFGFAPEAHLTEKSGLLTAANKVKLFDEWSKYWDLTKHYLLEKSPPNLIRSRFLQAMFPNSRIIVILRHPVAVSLATSKWTDSSLESLMEHWLVCHQIFEQDRPHLKQVHVIRYEDLIRETGRSLEGVWEFLGLAPQPSSALDSSGNDRYFNAWRKLSAEKRGAARVHRMVEHYEERAQRFGYSLLECESLAPLP